MPTLKPEGRSLGVRVGRRLGARDPRTPSALGGCRFPEGKPAGRARQA